MDGSVLSMTSVSLESRLRIRPVGVLSKNDIGFRRTRCNVFSKRCMEARIVPFAKINAPPSTVTPTMIGENFGISLNLTIIYQGLHQFLQYFHFTYIINLNEKLIFLAIISSFVISHHLLNTMCKSLFTVTHVLRYIYN